MEVRTASWVFVDAIISFSFLEMLEFMENLDNWMTFDDPGPGQVP